MPGLVRAVMPALLITALATPAAAQVAQQSAVPRTPESIVASLEGQLRNLVSAQEYFYSTRNMYSNSLAQLGYKAVEGAYVMVFRADNAGWAGRAVHPELAGRSCVIWVGPTGEMANPRTDHQGRTTTEGKPVCDVP